MSNYTAVITGGNKGIGADLARAMLARGWRVVSIARHKGEAKHPALEHVEADLMDPAAVAPRAARSPRAIRSRISSITLASSCPT
jgi:3-oxoacyl-[acyl-carrier protein] reductase